MQKDRHIHFTEKTVATLPLPKTGQIWYNDAGCPNLYLVVGKGGTRTYMFARKFQGRLVKVKIGTTVDKKLFDAHAEAEKLSRMAADGIKPINQRQILLKDITISQFYNEHYRPKHSVIYKQLKSIRSDDDLMKLHVKPIANRKLLSFTKNEFNGFFANLMQQNSVYIANRTLSLLRHMYTKAIEWEVVPVGTINPVSGIKKFPEKSRDRFLTGEEVAKIFTALANNPNDTFKEYIMLSLYLGQRKENMLAMKWEHVDFENKSVLFPKTKNGEAITVPLVDQAYNMLKYMYNNALSKEWVFPGPHSASGHYSDPKSAWKTLLKQAGLENLRLHDLRRTLGSYQAISGSSLAIIGKSLGHKSVSATQVYARLSMDPVRNSMQNAVDNMMAFITNK